MVTKEMTTQEAVHIITPHIAGKLNARPAYVHQFLRHVVDDLLGGIFDSWKTWHDVLRDSREDAKFMFVHELFYLWPLICGCQCLAELDMQGALDNIFKGSAAETFRSFVLDKGLDEGEYPFYLSGPKVLKTWKGANFAKEGNNLVKNDTKDTRKMRFKRTSATRKKP